MSYDIEAVRSRLTIDIVYAPYGEIKRIGNKDKMVCPLPTHTEKTPSFVINEDLSFHCFGCNGHGSPFSFIETMQGVEFVDALQYLAEKVGVEPKLTGAVPDSEKYARIFDANKAAMEYYCGGLNKSPEAMRYLTNRGYTDETIRKFHLGCSNGGGVVSFLRQKGFTLEEIAESGLSSRKDKAKDFFYSRVMFPIIQRHKVLGFSGRSMEKDPEIKFVNTRETPVFKKSEIVYGMDPVAIKKAGFAFVVEGNSDVNMCHQYGHCNTVAPLGSAFGLSHVKLIMKHTNAVYPIFDGDVAGEKASLVAANLLFHEKAGGGILLLEKGEDPDTFLRKGNSVGTLVKTAIPFGVYIVMKQPHRRKEIINILLQMNGMAMAEFQSYMRTPEEIAAVEEYSAKLALQSILGGSPILISKEGIEVVMHHTLLLLFVKGRFILKKDIGSDYKLEADALFDEAMALRQKIKDAKEIKSNEKSYS
jgi:DNA primase